MKARIAYRLLEYFRLDCLGKTALDVGCGTGLITRFLRGLPGLRVIACDTDPKAQMFFKTHPELTDVPYVNIDILNDQLPGHYDAIISSGVYHHIPKSQRPAFLRHMWEHSDIFIIADEGIQEYANEMQRRRNCERWYGFVIHEATRMGLATLAQMESSFWKHEMLNTADDGLDFKESPTHLIEDSAAVGLVPWSVDRLGPWEDKGGGFYIAVFLHR